MPREKYLKEYEFIYDECWRMMASNNPTLAKFVFEIKDVRLLANFIHKTYKKLEDLKKHYGE